MQSVLVNSLKRLAGKSVVYTVGGVVMRGLGFLLLPLYTRYMTREDYGLLSVSTVLLQILTIVYPLGLPQAVTRSYFAATKDAERKSMAGTLWLTIVVFSGAMTLVLDRLGPTLFPAIFSSLPFDPFVRMTLWTAFFNAITQLPLVFFQIQERPRAYIITVILSQLVNYGLIIAFLVLQRQGAYSYLQGTFLAMALLNIPYLLLTIRQIRVALQWPVLLAGLSFGLPLVPHALAGWVLDFADRAILQRFVSLDALGLYSLGYTFGSLMLLLAQSVNNAWVPFFYRAMNEQGPAARANLSKLVTYYSVVLGFFALGQMLFIRELIVLFTAPAFHSAYTIAYWIIAGQFLNGLSYIPANLLMFHQRTRILPLVTGMAGLANVGLNLWLVPQYGIIASAWVTFLSYVLMLVLMWGLAQRQYGLPYEYGRLGRLAVALTLIFGVGASLPPVSIWISLPVKAVLLLALPLALYATGFFTPSEKMILAGLKHRVLG